MERKSCSLSPWKLTILWKKWGRLRGYSVPVYWSGNHWLPESPIFLWSCIIDWWEKGPPLIIPSAGRLSAEPGTRAKQHLSCMNTVYCTTTPSHLWLDLEANKYSNKDNLCWWQMRWKTKGKNHLRVLIHNSALHLFLLSPSFPHSTSPLMDEEHKKSRAASNAQRKQSFVVEWCCFTWAEYLLEHIPGLLNWLVSCTGRMTGHTYQEQWYLSETCSQFPWNC